MRANHRTQSKTLRAGRPAPRARRDRRDISQVELARRAGLHPSTISLWARGIRIAPESLARIARALGVDVATLGG